MMKLVIFQLVMSFPIINLVPRSWIRVGLKTYFPGWLN